MDELISSLKYLKTASSKNPYPPYAQYLHSNGHTLTTCNGEVFAKAYLKLPFKGDINVFVFENNLKNLGYDCNMIQKGDNLIIEKNNYKTKLVIDDMDFPEIKTVDVETIEITEDLLKYLKLALKYTSTNIMSQYVYLCKDYLCAHTNNMVFYKTHSLDLKEPIGLNKEVISILKVGDKIGVKDNNLVVYFENGYILFQCDKMDDYPSDKVENLITLHTDKDIVDLRYLMNMNSFNQIILALEPIFFGEKMTFASFENNNNKMTATASSAINGISTYDIDTSLKEKFKFNIDLLLMKNILPEYDIFVDLKGKKDVLDSMLISNNASYIIIKGGI